MCHIEWPPKVEKNGMSTRFFVATLLLGAVVLLNIGCGVCAPGDMSDAVTTPFVTKYGFTVYPQGHRVIPTQIWETITMVEDGLREIGTWRCYLCR
jgi:hypothetical protein